MRPTPSAELKLIGDVPSYCVSVAVLSSEWLHSLNYVEASEVPAGVKLLRWLSLLVASSSKAETCSGDGEVQDIVKGK